MSEGGEKKSGFKVMDRRRFDSDGNSRANGTEGEIQPKSEPVAAQPAGRSAPQRDEVFQREHIGQRPPPSEATRPQPQPQGTPSQGTQAQQSSGSGDAETEMHNDEEGEGEQSDFLSFVHSLATQAAAMLSGVDVRTGMSIPPEPRAAQEYIAIIEMLRVRTKGNLSPQESAMLDQLLHQLRIAFVRATRGAAV